MLDNSFPLTGEQRRQLEMLAEHDSADGRVARRARIVLWHADGYPATEVAAKAHATRTTVHRWVRRYREHGLDALLATEPADLLLHRATERIGTVVGVYLDPPYSAVALTALRPPHGDRTPAFTLTFSADELPADERTDFEYMRFVERTARACSDQSIDIFTNSATLHATGEFVARIGYHRHLRCHHTAINARYLGEPEPLTASALRCRWGTARETAEYPLGWLDPRGLTRAGVRLPECPRPT